jgi:hypothetical protein
MNESVAWVLFALPWPRSLDLQAFDPCALRFYLDHPADAVVDVPAIPVTRFQIKHSVRKPGINSALPIR